MGCEFEWRFYALSVSKVCPVGITGQLIQSGDDDSRCGVVCVCVCVCGGGLNM